MKRTLLLTNELFLRKEDKKNIIIIMVIKNFC